MTDSKFANDQKEAAQFVKETFLSTGRRREDVFREAVDKVAGKRSLKYRQDLFSVIRETWPRVAN